MSKFNACNMFKKFSQAAILLLLLFGAAELAAFAFYTINKDKFLASDTSAFIPSQELINLETQVFDPHLGWKKRFPTAYGQRPQARLHPRAMIATYGDSFTYCDEVLGFETWQTHLSGLLQAGVWNFGNGGYGPDQAYLRFQQDQPQAKTPYAVMGLIGENIARVVNVYRRFYLPQDGNALTKPRFRLEGGHTTFLPNPTPTLASRQRLRDVEFLRSIGQNDYWYLRRAEQTASFPYSSLFFNINLLQEVMNYFDWMQLWEEPEPTELLLKILKAFAVEAKARGWTPIIGIYPMEQDLQQVLQTGALPVYVEIITAFCADQGIVCFDGVSAMARSVATGEEVRSLFLATHYSPLGNERLAMAWYAYLRATFPEDFQTYAELPQALSQETVTAQGSELLPRTRGRAPLRRIGAFDDGAPAQAEGTPSIPKDSEGFARHLLALGRGEGGGPAPATALAFLTKQLDTDAQSAAELAQYMLLSDVLLAQPDMDDARFLATLGSTLWGFEPDADQTRQLLGHLSQASPGQRRATRADVFYDMLWDDRFRALCGRFGVRPY